MSQIALFGAGQIGQFTHQRPWQFLAEHLDDFCIMRKARIDTVSHPADHLQAVVRDGLSRQQRVVNAPCLLYTSPSPRDCS